MSGISLSSLLRIARSGLLTQQFSIDSISANVANINTVGYKRSRAEFQELLVQAQQKPEVGDNRVLGQAAGASISANQRIFSQGNLQTTNRNWDLAVVGDGFFQVQMPDGTTAYTRDGAFQVDGEGQITTASGYLVSPNIAIPPDAEDVFVGPDGGVMVRRLGDTEPQTIANLSLARFNNPAGLESLGGNLYRATDASGTPDVAAPGTGAMGQIVSGALEGSNVELSQEMVDLVSAQRAYSMMTRALKVSDDMLSMVNQMRG